MPDPAVVPWFWCWIGLAIAITGGLAAVACACRPHQSFVAIRIGIAVLAIGVLTMLYPPFVNGTQFLARVVIELVRPQQYEVPTQQSGLSFFTSWNGPGWLFR